MPLVGGENNFKYRLHGVHLDVSKYNRFNLLSNSGGLSLVKWGKSEAHCIPPYNLARWPDGRICNYVEWQRFNDCGWS